MNAETTSYLFVGGPCDGQRRDTEGQRRYHVAVRNHPRTPPLVSESMDLTERFIDVACYELVRVVNASNYHSAAADSALVYSFIGLEHERQHSRLVVQQLMKNYRPAVVSRKRAVAWMQRLSMACANGPMALAEEARKILWQWEDSEHAAGREPYDDATPEEMETTALPSGKS